MGAGAYATPANTLLFLCGGSVTAAIIDNDAFLLVDLGVDQAATLLGLRNGFRGFGQRR